MYCEKIELPSQLLLEYLNRLFYNALLFTSLFKEIPKNKYILFVGENYETQLFYSSNILIHVLMTYVFMPFREIVHTFMFSNKIKTHALPWI